MNKQIPDAAVQAAIEEFNKTRRVMTTEYQRMEYAFAAALPHLQLGFEVKKLEWHPSQLRDNSYLAPHGFGENYVAYLSGDIWRCVGKELPDLEAAIAAAQADFERRVRECVVAKPVDVAAVRKQALEEEFAIDKLRFRAFHTNSDADRQNYFEAVSKWFQDRHIRALSAEPAQGEQWRPTHRHVKRGTKYQLIGTGKIQAKTWADLNNDNDHKVDMREIAIYRGDDGALWVRPIEEFNDGRFEPLPAPTTEAGR